jgi:hypothetical protein
MKAKRKYRSEIDGHLDIFVSEEADEYEGEIDKRQTVLIHGDPEGLRSFARLLLKMADLNQEELSELPVGDSEHIHLNPGYDFSKSSVEVILGRLDQKGSDAFYDRFVPRDL